MQHATDVHIEYRFVIDFSVKGCGERGSQRTKYKATVMSFYATCNLRTYLITSRNEYDSLVRCERHHVAYGTDSRHVRFEFAAFVFLCNLSTLNLLNVDFKTL